MKRNLNYDKMSLTIERQNYEKTILLQTSALSAVRSRFSWFKLFFIDTYGKKTL